LEVAGETTVLVREDQARGTLGDVIWRNIVFFL
jgi:hypothetical protein